MKVLPARPSTRLRDALSMIVLDGLERVGRSVAHGDAHDLDCLAPLYHRSRALVTAYENRISELNDTENQRS